MDWRLKALAFRVLDFPGGKHAHYFRKAGFTILEENAVPGEPSAEVVNNVAPQFRQYEPADLFALRGRIVAR
jgi:hypothetical protein